MQSKKCNIEGKRVAFLTLGCKVNSYETEGMRELLLKAGALETDFNSEADIYIVNTCSVTNMADRKSRQMLHRAKKKNPAALIVAAGCYVQAAGENLAAREEIDLIVGNNQKARIAELIEEALTYNNGSYGTLLDIGKEKAFEEMMIETITERTRAYIKIEDGCNQFCSYCIIPYVRGRVRSREEKEILEEISRLAREGYKEVVLTGIHLSSYGLERFDETFATVSKNSETVFPLLELLKKVQNIDGIERIRLGSLEPRIMTEGFVRELALLTKICPHFHLSLQSGCDATLKRMNRKYTTGEYRVAVETLRRYFDNPAVTTDIIVGFPGENEEEFAETLRFAETVAFSQIHIFKYSRRGGTVADRMSGQVPEQIKSRRSDALEQVESALREAYIGKFFNSTESVLLEEAVELEGMNYMVGHTTRYVKVFVPKTGENLQANETVSVSVSEQRIGDGVLADLL